MCSETLIQDYHNNRGNHVLQYNTGNHLSRHSSAMMATTSPMNTLTGDSNIYMEPTLATGNYLSQHTDSQHNSLTSHHNHCQTAHSTHYLPNGNTCAFGNGSVPSSPLSTLSPPTSPSAPHPPSLPPYLTDSLSSNPHQHQYQTPLETQIPQPYFVDHLILQTQEFLPLCDLLFNIISLAAYFCDVVFDSVTAYTLYLQRDTLWLSVTLGLILFSALVSQILSYRWYTRKSKDKQSVNVYECEGASVLTIHVLLLGVLWRYFKLFIPVDLSSVKHEVRDLCVLRMVHAFCEAAPMLIIQVYLLFMKTSADQITDLNIISIFLSLFSLCWALASFSKNVRAHNIHKLVLTWLGVIFQFFWRLGTISSRVVALTVYATIYSYWVFAVIVLHWFSMLLWLLSPKNLFYGEKMSSIKRICYSSLIAWVYIFCYINMQEDNSRNRMIAFYLTMFLENTLLLSICLTLSTVITPWLQCLSIVFVWGGFAIGMLFMILYYKFFHIRHLKHTLLATHYDQIEYAANHCPEHGSQPYSSSNGGPNTRMNGLSSDRKLQIPLMNSGPNGVITAIPGVFNCRLNPALKRKKKKPSTFIPPPHPHISAPNTLNTITSTISSPSSNNLGSLQSNKSITKTTKAPPVPSPTAFWKKSDVVNGFLHSQSISPIIATSPLTLPAKHPFSASIAPSPVANFTTDLHQQLRTPTITPINKPQLMIPNIPNSTPIPTPQPIVNNSSRKTPELKNQNSVSRVNIQQKLQEKKQQQFMQLKKIEEEIKQGIISKPHILDRIESPPLIHKSVAPQAKKQPWVANNTNSTGTANAPFVPLGNRGIHHYYYHPVYRRIKLRSQTPEVLLSPHYLDNSRVFYDYPSCVLPPIQSRLLKVPLENSAEEEEEEEEAEENNVGKVENKMHTINEQKRNAKNVSKRDFKVNNNYNDINNQINRFSSDIDSQVSLPRSYTLPREFQYYRAGHASASNAINGVADAYGYLKCSRIRKPLAAEHIHPNVESNSSNDGDVDSDINPEEDLDLSAVPKIIRGPVNNMRAPAVPIRPVRDYHHHSRYKRHETPL